MAGVKQEVVNTFEKGLVMDLNPINTPNNVLTDCLNGTYITYDGNEFQLQNDRGNIPLRYSKLPEGYLPVGTTSYGDILYVVSYNPITNKTQIGTFPSPKLRSAYDNNCELSNTSILTQAIDEMDDPIKYTEAVEQYQRIVVYVDGEGNEELIINPGDQYCIEDPDRSDYEIYEKLQYFILTDKKELIEITDQVIADGEMHYVKWKIPGYLSTRWRLPQINENGFTVRTKGIHLDKDSDTTELTATINCQIGSDDTLLDGIYEHESLCIAELNEDDSIKTFDEDKNITKIEERIKYNPVNYYITDVKCKDVIPNAQKEYQTILAPYVDIKEVERGLLFDQFKQASELIDLTNLFSPENTHIAKNYYYYTINKNIDGIYENATITFDIDCSIVSEGDVALNIFAMPLYKFINNNYTFDGFAENDWQNISHGNVFDGIGQNIVEVEFNQPEQIYIINLQMSDGISDPVNCYKVLICSEFMNNFDKDVYQDFEKITMNEWLHYLNELEIILEQEPTFDTPIIGDKYVPDLEYKDCFWTATEGSIDCFVLPDSEEKNRIDVWKRGYTYTIPNVKISFKHRQKYLYNFCVAHYAAGSELQIPKLNYVREVVFGSEVTDAARGDIEDNFYVERRYQDQNTEPTEGALFDFKPACDKRDLLVIELAQETMLSTSDRIDYHGANDIVKHLRTMIWGLRLNGSLSDEDDEIDPDIISGLSQKEIDTINNELKENYFALNKDVAIDGGQTIKGSIKLMSRPKVFNTVKDRSAIENMPKFITATVNNFLETEDIACVPTVIKIYHPTSDYATGISTDKFSTYAFVPGADTAGEDRCCFIYGVFFRTKDLGAFFVPITQMSEYAKYMHAYNDADDIEKKERDECGWDNSLKTPMKGNTPGTIWDKIVKVFSAFVFVFGGATPELIPVSLSTLLVGRFFENIIHAWYDEDGIWLINKSVYDKLWKFVNRLQVNTNYAQFIDGYFLNRTFLEDEIFDSLSIEYNYKTSISNIKIINTDVTLSKNSSFIQNEPIKLAEFFSTSWEGSIIEKSDIVISGKKICSFNDKSVWPYIGENSLKEIDSQYDDQNDIILTQQEEWPNSIEFQNVASGTSLGFYRRGDANYNLDQFVSLLHMTYNSDYILYQNKSIGKLSNVYADVSKDSIDQYWAFSCNNSDQYDPEYNFEELGGSNNKTDPRYKLFVSKDMPYMDIINILKETEEDETES